MAILRQFLQPFIHFIRRLVILQRQPLTCMVTVTGTKRACLEAVQYRRQAKVWTVVKATACMLTAAACCWPSR